jgi:hypothetical protein
VESDAAAVEDGGRQSAEVRVRVRSGPEWSGGEEGEGKERIGSGRVEYGKETVWERKKDEMRYKESEAQNVSVDNASCIVSDVEEGRDSEMSRERRAKVE